MKRGLRPNDRTAVALGAPAVLLALSFLLVIAGCGGKYDKPLELNRVVHMGEYSYISAYRGFENSTSLSICQGSLYVSFFDLMSEPPTGTVITYFSSAAPVPENLVRHFNGLEHPYLVGAGKSGGDPTLTFSDPDWDRVTGLAVDDSGNVYVADAARNFVRSYKPSGRRRFTVDLADSGFGIGHVLSPMGLAIDNGTLLIAEASSEKAQVQRIRIDRPQTGIPFSADVPFINVYTDDEGNQMTLSAPIGVAAGSEGSIFVLDKGLGLIFRFDSDGSSIAIVNSEQQTGPTDVSDAVSVDAYDNPSQTSASVYVLDPSKGVIHRWDPK
jgi:hypothetical protein